MCRRIQVELAQPVFVDANIFQGHMQANATEYCVQYIYTLYIYTYIIYMYMERERERTVAASAPTGPAAAIG